MSLRVKGLEELGKGAWKVAEGYEVPKPSKNPHSESTTAPVVAQKPAGNVVPESMLYEALRSELGDLVVPKVTDAVPGRRFELDVAIPSLRIGVELDGWQFHGKYLKDFKRDRRKDRALVLNGWVVLRFTAGEVLQDVYSCVAVVCQLVDLRSET